MRLVVAQRLLPFVALGMLGGPSSAQQLPPFENLFVRQRVPTGVESSSGLALGDVTGDGQADAVVTGKNAIASVPGGPDGSFGSPIVTAIANASMGRLVLGDLDGDGHLDVVAHSSVQLFTLLGTGSGSFSLAQASAAPSNVASSVLADLTGDGELDLLTSHSAGVAIYPGSGTGQLGAAQILPVIVPDDGGAESVAVADMDGDGDLDIACGLTVTLGGLGLEKGVGVMRGDGAGHFALAELTELDVVFTPRIAVGDHEGDGDTDVFAAAPTGSDVDVSLCLNDGAGSLSAGPAIPAGSNGHLQGLAAADVRGDGLLDILTVYYLPDYNDSTLWITQLDARGGSLGSSTHTLGMHPWQLASADLNGDSAADVALVDLGTSGGVPSTLGTLLTDGQGGFLGPQAHHSDGGRTAKLLDLDGDGATDLLVAGYSGLGIWISGAAGNAESWTLLPLGYSAEGFGVGDVNGDGDLDAVLCDIDQGRVDVLRGDGAGDFAEPLSYFGLGAQGLAVGDVNEDGYADTLTADWSFAALTLLPGNAAGQPIPTAIFPTGKGPARVELADMNDDGHLDAVYGHCNTTQGGPGIAVLLGTGTGNFPVSIPAGKVLAVCGPSSPFTIGDLNGDGHRDLVYATSYSLTPLLGDGTGHLLPALPPPSTLSAPGTNSAPLLADVNGDGWPDLLTTEDSGADRAFRLMLGNGAGSFGPATWFHSDDPVSWVGAADVDGDLRPDIVALKGSLIASFPSHNLVVYSNIGPLPTWAPLGGALAGSFDTPSLTGTGLPSGGNTVRLAIDGMQPFTATTLVIGLGVLDAPFKGGVMVPVPQIVIAGLPLDAAGFFALSAPWPAGLPSGLQVAYQAWQSDAAGPKSFSATNGLLSLTP